MPCGLVAYEFLPQSRRGRRERHIGVETEKPTAKAQDYDLEPPQFRRERICSPPPWGSPLPLRGSDKLFSLEMVPGA